MEQVQPPSQMKSQAEEFCKRGERHPYLRMSSAYNHPPLGPLHPLAQARRDPRAIAL